MASVRVGSKLQTHVDEIILRDAIDFEPDADWVRTLRRFKYTINYVVWEDLDVAYDLSPAHRVRRTIHFGAAINTWVPAQPAPTWRGFPEALYYQLAHELYGGDPPYLV